MRGFDQKEIEKKCSGAAEQLLSYPWKVWFWGDSIGLEGLLAASELLRDRKYESFVYGLFKGWAGRQEPQKKFDHTAAGLALVRLYERYRDPHLLKVAEKHAKYLRSFRVLDNGCPVHYEDAHLELPPELPPDHPEFDPKKEEQRRAMQVENGGACIFVDSVHFQAPFWAKLAQITGNKNYEEEALITLRGQVEKVWDPKGQLFNHFWIEHQNQRNGVLWGRGQGWGLQGILETLCCLPPGHEAVDEFVPILQATATRMAELQDKSGDWRTVLDHPDSYLETSVAAFVVSAFYPAIEHGWIDHKLEEVAERAWHAMHSHMREDGVFAGVSFETFPSMDPEHYKKMPVDAMVPWGQGPYLTACMARYRYEEEVSYAAS